MRNDVSPPPMDPDSNGSNGSNSTRANSTGPQSKRPVFRSIGGSRRPDLDPNRIYRAHQLDRAASHSGGTEIVFNDPEDRGAAFNTTMSAIVAGSVFAVLAVIAWLMFK